MGFGRISNAMFVGFWSGAGRFVLKLLDMDLRTNLGTSAREFTSFSQIGNLPNLTVDALTTTIALHGESSIKPFCLVRHSTVFTTSLLPGGSDPSYLCFPKACPATVVCCLWSRVLWLVSCTRAAPVFSRLVSCTLRVLVVDHGEQLFKWVVMCLCVPCYMFLGFWNAMGVTSGEFVSLLSSVQCSSSCLRVCASLSTSVSCYYVRAMPTLSVSVIVASETADLYVRSLNHVVPSVSMIWLCPRTLLNSAPSLVGFGAACPLFLVAEHCFQPSVSSHSVRVGIRVVDPAH